MAIKNDSPWGTRSAKIGLALSVIIAVVSLFSFATALEKRTSILENQDMSKDKTINRIDNNIIRLHDKVDKLISRFEYERGRNETD